MGYTLQAIIGKREVLAAHAGDFPRVRVATLRQGFALIPLVEELSREICDSPTDEYPPSAFRETNLPAGFAAWLSRIANDGPVAYVEAEFFGGEGAQIAWVQHDSERIEGPFKLATPGERDWAEDDGETVSAISRALRLIGVERFWSSDEFEALGLSGRRSTEYWFGEGGIDVSPDAALKSDWVDVRIERGDWANADPLIRLETDERERSGDEARVRLTVNGLDLFGTDDDPWETGSVAYLATEGLAWLRWAACGAHSIFPWTKARTISIGVFGEVASILTTPHRRWAEVPYRELLAAWEAFAADVTTNRRDPR